MRTMDSGLRGEGFEAPASQAIKQMDSSRLPEDGSYKISLATTKPGSFAQKFQNRKERLKELWRRIGE